jgi:hypothetical protein
VNRIGMSDIPIDPRLGSWELVQSAAAPNESEELESVRRELEEQRAERERLESELRDRDAQAADVDGQAQAASPESASAAPESSGQQRRRARNRDADEPRP